MDYVDSLESHFRWDSMDKAEPATSHDLKLLPGEIVYSLTAWIEEGGRRVESARVYCRRGDAHLFQGALGLAEAGFNRALEFNLDLADAYYGRANVRKQQGADSAAVADLERALDLDPQHRAALIDRRNARREGGQFEVAMHDFDAVVLPRQDAVEN